jgi:segregation and condensation protein B
MWQRHSGRWTGGGSRSWRGIQRAASANSRANWFFIHFLSACDAPVNLRPAAAATEREKMQIVEAVLFVARDSLSSRKLAQVAGLADATEARTLVRLLNHRYDSSGRVFRIEEVAGGFCLLTRPQFAPWLRRMRHVPGELRLTQSAMESLAIVAYRQPVPRADIEAIRGVSCGEILKQLMQRDLIRICGRSEDLGRPYLYGTTRLFLQMFGLRSADRLPRSEWINGPSGIAPSNNVTMSQSSSEHDSGTGIDAKESTVRQSFSAATLLQDSVDPAEDIVLGAHILRAVEDDDDADYFEDEDEEDDEDDFDDEEEDEIDDEDAEDLDEEEEAFEDEEDDEDDDWEEVDDEEDGEEEEWDDEEDEDWDDEGEDEEEDEDEDWD